MLTDVRFLNGVIRFIHNVRPRFIYEIWGDSHLTQHFEDKLAGLVARDKDHYRTRDVMVRFMSELDNVNMAKLAEHIDKYHVYHKNINQN